jgi:hypothetical protein
MDSKPQRRTGMIEHTAPPPGPEAADNDLKAEARKYKAHQKAITRGLRHFFDTVAAEPVPDEFMNLLRKMDEGRQE